MPVCLGYDNRKCTNKTQALLQFDNGKVLLQGLLLLLLQEPTGTTTATYTILPKDTHERVTAIEIQQTMCSCY